jgi:arylsulfatase A-like enzyme
MKRLDNLSRREFIKTLGLSAAAASVGGITCGIRKEPKERLPNIVLIFTDDQGYADVGCYGAQGFETPNLDRMAENGIRFTDFYVTQPVCGASRAGLLTGCYPNRIGLMGAPDHNAKHGIHENEMTIAELLKQHNYATAIYGKWHLGHLPRFLPTRHGFDDYFGLPYSNDMWPWHPERPKDYIDLPLIEGEKTIAYNPDMSKLTTWYTERAVKFIEENKDNPFFLYVPHSMAHVPLGVSEKFAGKSEQGMYGDVIMELDWSVGQILSTLNRLGLENDTLIIFTSDNGPWISYGDHAGTAAPLREAKGTTWEGGLRVPCIMHWPGKIPPSTVCREPAMTIDILPTITGLVDAKLPQHKIDGLDIWPLISGKPGARSPHEAYFFYQGNKLEAVRFGRWKLHFPHKYRTLEGRPGGTAGIPVKYSQAETDLALFDLESDIGEKLNVASVNPQIVEQIKEIASKFDAELQLNRRPRGTVEE